MKPTQRDIDLALGILEQNRGKLTTLGYLVREREIKQGAIWWGLLGLSQTMSAGRKS